MRKTGIKKRGWLFVLSLILLFLFYLYGYLNPPAIELSYSKEILGNKGELLYAFLSPDDKWRLETENGQVPKRLKEWILWKEDKWFYHHPGVNPTSVLKSGFRNLIAGKRLSGASTITMQAVKMYDPKPRTWWTKIQETICAIRWECGLSKDEILRYYLSNLPFGGNIEGFRAASLVYFGKEPGSLSLAESAALIVIPNQPNRFHPLRNPEKLRVKRNQFLDKLYESQLITKEEWKTATLEPIHASKHKMPNEIPHLAQHLFQSTYSKTRTSIDRRIQQDMMQLFSAYALRMKRLRVMNASLLVAERKTGNVVAWIGNPDFDDRQNAGQVNGVLAIRSPGSTLKPFIYALGLQKGLITPKTVLYDIPTEFGTYLPENFDSEFMGAVTVEKALLQSLNIPAIGLLKEVGVDTFMHYTDKMGMQLLRSKTSNPGLSLAVGGCGTTLYELVQAYATLANLGKFIPLQTSQINVSEDFTPALSAPAAGMVRHILSASQRQEAIIPFVENPQKFGAVCWKTGTSFGHRDAWCIGYGSRYVVGVWFGNFSGEGRPELNGIDIAAPVFQQVIAHLETNVTTTTVPDLTKIGWKERKVCGTTGLKPGPNCTHVTTDLYLPLISSTKTCTHRKSLMVNTSETLQYCPLCKPATGTREILIEDYPSNYEQFLQAKGQTLRMIPPHNPNCPMANGEGSIEFLTPLPGKEFFLEKLAVIQLPLKAVSRTGDYPLRFYANGKLAGESRNGEEVIVAFGQGKYKIMTTDSRGRSASVTISVNAF